MREIAVQLMNYREFDELVRKTYLRANYEFIAAEEARNDSYYACLDMDGKSFTDPVWRKQLDEFIAGLRYSVSRYHLIDDMIDMGVLKPGSYLISVSW